MVVIGFASGDIPKMATNYLLLKSASAVGFFWGNYGARGHPFFMESIAAVTKLLAEKRIEVAPASDDIARFVDERPTASRHRDTDSRHDSHHSILNERRQRCIPVPRCRRSVRREGLCPGWRCAVGSWREKRRSPARARVTESNHHAR